MAYKMKATRRVARVLKDIEKIQSYFPDVSIRTMYALDASKLELKKLLAAMQYDERQGHDNFPDV